MRAKRKNRGLKGTNVPMSVVTLCDRVIWRIMELQIDVKDIKRMLRKARTLTLLNMWVGMMGIAEIFGQERKSQNNEISKSGSAGISGNAVQ